VNFLELCRAVRREAGIAGSGPVAVAGQVGEADRIVQWVSQAWTNIQLLRPDWNFLRSNFALNTTQGVREYAPSAVGIAATHDRYLTETFRIYRTAEGVASEGWLNEWAYPVFRDTYQFGAQAPGMPTVFSIRPQDDAILLGPVPDGEYTITGERITRPIVLIADADTPVVRPEFHSLIVARAIIDYAYHEAAPESLAKAQLLWSELWPRFEQRYLPEMGSVAPWV